MDIHQLPIPSIILIAIVLAIGVQLFIRAILASQRYQDHCGRSTGLSDFKKNSPWWSEVTKFQMENCGNFAVEDYSNFAETGFVSSLIKAGYEVEIKKVKNGVNISYKNWADDVY